MLSAVRVAHFKAIHAPIQKYYTSVKSARAHSQHCFYCCTEQWTSEKELW